MALGANTLWELNASSTANMVNGGGFNRSNANFPTDGSWTSATGNAPVLTSATYTFVAGDVGAWVYSSNTTNPGFYKISSVSAGAATVNATIGAAVILSTITNRWGPSTAAGVDSSASVSSKTFGVDYSQSTAAVLTKTDLTCLAATAIIISATATFTPVMVGNIIHLTALTGTGAIVGWYEIISYTSATTVTLDRTPTNGVNNITAGTYFVGGALGFNSALDDAWAEIVIGGNTVFGRAGTYPLGTAIAVASAAATGTNPALWLGYQSIRGDNPISAANWPTITVASISAGIFQNYERWSFSSPATACFTSGSDTINRFIKTVCTSTTTNRLGHIAGVDSVTIGLEAVCQFGTGAELLSNGGKFINAFIHDCAAGGIITASSRQQVIGCIIASCLVAGINTSSSANPVLLMDNTIYGYGTPQGSGILISANVISVFPLNNIITGCTSGITGTTTQQFSNAGMYNAFFGNTADVTLYTKDATDITGVNPTFAGVTELSGATATTSGSVLTQSGGNFSTVTDNVDYLQIHSGTGTIVGTYLITSHTTTTVTLNTAPGTSATADKVWTILTGKNFAIGTNLKAAGYPGVFPGGFTTGYTDTGAVPRQEQATGGSTGFLIF